MKLNNNMLNCKLKLTSIVCIISSMLNIYETLVKHNMVNLVSNVV